MTDWYWSPEETKKYWKSLNTVVNGGSISLKNIKSKILENGPFRPRKRYHTSSLSSPFTVVSITELK